MYQVWMNRPGEFPELVFENEDRSACDAFADGFILGVDTVADLDETQDYVERDGLYIRLEATVER